MSGDSVLIGAYGDDDKGDVSGSAYFFVRSGATWSQVDKIVASDGVDEDAFSCGCSIDGTSAVVSSIWDDDYGSKSGSAYVFELASLEDGEHCVLDAECVSGYCVDNVCCDSDCGGGVVTDCLACSIAQGALVDGICADRPDGVSCDDGNSNTENDQCNSGDCEGTATDTDADTDTDIDTDVDIDTDSDADIDAGGNENNSGSCGCLIVARIDNEIGLLEILKEVF